MHFVAELKRRNVIRMAGLYLVGAWLIVQVAATLLPTFDAPTWVMKVLVALLATGFVSALVFSWLYELTPEGLKRDGEVDHAQSIAPQTARRMDRLIVLGLVAVIGVVAADRYWPRDHRPTTIAADSNVPAAAADIDKMPTAASAASATAAAKAAGAGQLIAVLPFRNRSVREEDAYFTEGIHDDLLTQLSRIAAFKVISRTSMMRYQDSDKSVPEIARELGAAVLLEGAVQRSGDQVRITVQLIDGASDVHLWAQTYDRELNTENLFAIQADIAKAIADSMKVALSPAEAGALAAGSTRNLQAYEAFLRGKLGSGPGFITAEMLGASIAAYDRAIELDPAFADAWARKARAQLAGYWYGVGLDSRVQRDAARASLEQAQKLAPESIETLLAQAYFHYWGQLDYAGADGVLQRVLERVPDDVEAWLLRGFVARRDGRFDDAITAFQRTVELDPVKLEGYSALVETHANLGHAAQAAEALAKASALGSEDYEAAVNVHEARGDAEAAWSAVEGPAPNSAALPFRAAMLSRDPARVALSLSPTLWPLDRRNPSDFPEIYVMAQAESLLLTEPEPARRLLEQIQARMQARPYPYPGGWRHNSYYFPSDLPGMLGDLDGVRAAERSYLATPRDAWAARDIQLSLAIAFARSGDPERAMHYLENIAATFGPASYLRFSIHPGLDAVREHPRYLALKAAYEAFAANNPEA